MAKLVKIYRRDSVKLADNFVKKLKRELERCYDHVYSYIPREYERNYRDNVPFKAIVDAAIYYSNTSRYKDELIKEIQEYQLEYNIILEKIKAIEMFKKELQKMKKIKGE